MIYIDLEKAFDKVVHFKLLHRLKSLSIGENVFVWIENFLTLIVAASEAVHLSKILSLVEFYKELSWALSFSSFT